jgi:WD40 repeat protein
MIGLRSLFVLSFAMYRLALALVLSIPTTALAIDPAKIDRKIGKEPVYQTKAPKYGLLVFGSEAKDKVWLVWDGDKLYVDRNGNGDLTDPGELVAAKKKEKLVGDTEGYTFEVGEVNVAGHLHKGLTVYATPLVAYSSPSVQKLPEVKSALAKDPKAMVFTLAVDVDVPGIKGGGLGGRLNFHVGMKDINGVLLFGEKPADAPIVHLGGPLELTFYDQPNARVGRSSEFDLVVGTPGIGPGTFAMLAYNNTIPKSAKAVIEATFQSKNPGDPPLKEKYVLNERCCTVNLYDSVRVPQKAAPSTGTFKLTLDGWQDGNVGGTTHNFTVLPRIDLKVEPVAANLFATLSNPRTQAERNAGIWTLKFSRDGKRLFSSAYPTGVIQVWDVAEKRELIRIESPKGLRGSAEYALFSPDEKTVYVPVETRKVLEFEVDGKKSSRLEYSGAIRVWDLNTGEEKTPLQPPVDHAADFARLSPDGHYLACVEMVSFNTGEKRKCVTVVWDLKTGERKEIANDYCMFSFSPDGKTLALQSTDHEAKTSVVRLLEIGTYRELAKMECSDKDRFFSLGRFSPDGSVLAVSLGGKLGAPREEWFRDGKSLEDRGRFTAEGDPDRYGWGGGMFISKGTQYFVINSNKKGGVWDLAGKKLVKPFAFELSHWLMAMSLDEGMLATVSIPKVERELDDSRSDDPRDQPQPRVTLYDLAGEAKPQVLITPPGFMGAVAFSPDGKTLAFGSSGGIHLFDLSKR